MTQLNHPTTGVLGRRDRVYAAVTESDMAAFHSLIADHYADLNDIYLACARAELDPTFVFETYTQWLNETAASVRATAVPSAPVSGLDLQSDAAGVGTERCDSYAESATYAEALERAETAVAEDAAAQMPWEAIECSRNSPTFNPTEGLPQGLLGATTQPSFREIL